MRVSALLQEYRFELASAGLLIAMVVAVFVLDAWCPAKPFDTDWLTE